MASDKYGVSISSNLHVLDKFVKDVQTEINRVGNDVVTQTTDETHRKGQKLMDSRIKQAKPISRNSLVKKLFNRVPHKPAIGYVGVNPFKWGRWLHWPIDGGLKLPGRDVSNDNYLVIPFDQRLKRAGKQRMFDLAEVSERNRKVVHRKYGERFALKSVPFKKGHGRLILRETKRRGKRYHDPVGVMVTQAKYPVKFPFQRVLDAIAAAELRKHTRPALDKSKARLNRRAARRRSAARVR